MTAESMEQALGTMDHLVPLQHPARIGRGHIRLARPWQETAPTGYERWGKRFIDVVGSGVLLVLLAPLLGCVAVGVLLSLGRPVLFRQERVGRGGATFTVLKFRTMLEDRRRTPGHWHGNNRRRTHKSEADPRHTRVGRVLRKTSLDELPQLWNVLKGDMSLVGPRPELVEIVDRYAPWQHGRHVVRPGLTGLWQISARGDKPMHEVTHIDLDYVQHLSARLDMRILFGTPVALLRRKGS